ncbi:MAG: UDP-N-acetylmuramate--L-alanine ligase [Flavisolibacter sp.]
MAVDKKKSAGSLETLQGIKKVYFVGIGGIGMSAIARYFRSKGIEVSGYDKTPTALTKELEKEGIEIHYQESLELMEKNPDLVVYTPAVPKEHKELEYYRQNSFRAVKRSDVLQAISADSFNICVAGTHGKTTISTMIAHILKHSGVGCNAFLGGISVNYHTNFWSSENDVCVIEADEYDRSFLKLSPDIAAITAMDADHLDIYGDERSMQDAFIEFAGKVKSNGLLITKFGLPRMKEANVTRRLTYSLQNDAADIVAENVRIDQGGYSYDVRIADKVFTNFELRIGGMHNVENSLVAIAVADQINVSEEKIRSAISAFMGVRRRFEYILPPEKKKAGHFISPVLIDDYAHHPEELSALLKSVRSLFPGRIMTVVFQPHLFTRTRDLAEGFAEALSLADRIIVLPVYPARELPLPGVTSKIILDKIHHRDKIGMTKDELLVWIKKHATEMDKEFGEVIVMAGAGDIDALIEPVKKLIEKTS